MFQKPNVLLFQRSNALYLVMVGCVKIRFDNKNDHFNCSKNRFKLNILNPQIIIDTAAAGKVFALIDPECTIVRTLVFLKIHKNFL